MGGSLLAQWAVWYAEQGWPVFPVQPGGKMPALKAAHSKDDPLYGNCRGECGRVGHGCWDAVADPERIARYWRRHPNHNIGLRTGDVFDVLDLDPDDDGIENFDAWCADNGLKLDTADMLIVGTPRGGQHWYFAPVGSGNRAKMMGGGVDWRGHGGYVVAPPSRRDYTRVTYDWVSDPTTGIALPVCPQLLADLVSAPERDRRSPCDGAYLSLGISTATVGTSRYGQKVLDDECGRAAACGEGGRNSTLFAAACAVFRYVAGGEITPGDAEDGLWAAGRACGLPDGEIDEVMRKGWANGQLDPKSAPNQ